MLKGGWGATGVTGTGRAADDEVGVELDAGRRLRRSGAELVEEQAGRAPAHLALGDADGRERDREVGGDLDVVEPDDRHVARHVEAELGEGSEHAHRYQVIKARDPGRPVGRVPVAEQVEGDPVAVFEPGARRDDHAVVEPQGRPAERPLDAGPAIPAVLGVGGAAEVDDPLVAAVEEVEDGGL